MAAPAPPAMRPAQILSWIAVGALGALLLVASYERALPFAPDEWSLSVSEAEVIALERFHDLGAPVFDPYVVTRLTADMMLERRLQLRSTELGVDALAGGRLARRIFYYEVFVYAPGARPGEWNYRARIGLDGELLGLEMQLASDEDGDGAIDEAAARTAADRFLEEQGFDLALYEEPEPRSQQLDVRTDLTFRYRGKEQELGAGYPYGVQVRFAGGTLGGYRYWFDDPENEALSARMQPFQFLGMGRMLSVLVLLPLVAIPFLRRYHHGEIGVRRGLQLGGLVLGSAIVLMVLSARYLAEGSSTGFLARVQMSWMAGFWLVAFLFLPVALMAFLAWSVGESLCRERWGHKLAAFDALFSGSFGNATVAGSCLRGTAAGLLLAGSLLGGGWLLRGNGVWPSAAFEYQAWWLSSHWAGIVILAYLLVFVTYSELFGRLFLVSWFTRKLGTVPGAALAVLAAGLLCWSPNLGLFSIGGTLVMGVLTVGLLVALFLRYDLMTSVTAALVSSATAAAFPLLSASDNWLQFQGSLAVLGAALPMVLSLRSVSSGRQFRYSYDDVPPHVRRIAERERQRVELETARRIQSSILPELPPQLNGVRIAHSYLPASEVGGDFYDVMALEDGRLAVAVGDVAGHGVSSGLVMSMAKSALAVQVTFDPEVESVFATLNRMVYQSARRRLLTTLCYVLLDPVKRELHYASAGHLFPYRISTAGSVRALESVSYPLGVRGELEVSVRSAGLDPGDLLFLFSDGVVEAREEDSEELFGFERLEASLARHGNAGVTGIRDGVLSDLESFTGAGPREDDLTVVVLQLP